MSGPYGAHLSICGQCGVSGPCWCDLGTNHLHDGCPDDEWEDDLLSIVQTPVCPLCGAEPFICPACIECNGEAAAPVSITCPRCGRTSWNPNDVREGYCGACHDWTTSRA